MLQYSNTMNLDHFNDFYYLEALKVDIGRRMAANPELQFRHSVVKLMEDTEELFNRVAPNLAFRTFVYIWAACLGEARHACEIMCKNRFLKEINKSDRRDVYSMTKMFPPTPENIKAVVEVFADKWSGSFGGDAWKHIAESLFFYEKDPTTFIDHVIDLQHNTGTVFSKSEARDALAFQVEYSGSLNEFLDYKFRCDILTEAHWENVRVSREVYLLVKRHNIVFLGKDVSYWLKPSFHILPDYGFKWGKKRLTLEQKWSEFADVTKGNKPEAYQLKSKIWNEIIRQIWMEKEDLRRIARDEFAKYNCKNKKEALKRIYHDIDEARDYNEKKAAMIHTEYKLAGDVARTKTPYGYFTYATKTKVSYENKYEDGYLTLEKGVLYLHTKDDKIQLRYDEAPYFIRNVEAECITK